ncbi:MAG: hypothetical protein A2147_10850 [Chloroflexi bacterium RBG_16_57_8]|nr:MAG: hypothetical protein A2147_10850 [Chloroflexi bacterium RBG_16_57_8]
MDKQEQVGIIKLSIDGINYLRTLPFHNGEFPAWRERVTQLMGKIYGKDSTEYRRFVNAPGKSFVIRTETGQIEEYHRKLDCYESALKSLIGEE